MTYKDSIEWLKSLKNQISQSQHQDLWHFEQAIDEIILKLQPLVIKENNAEVSLTGKIGDC